MKKGQKYIYLILTHPQSVVSDIIHIVTREPYTHAALSLSPKLSPMFSFSRKYSRFPFWGSYKKESFSDGFWKSCTRIPGRVIAIPVSAEQRDYVARKLYGFWEKRESLKYNVRGLFLNAVGIAYAKPAHYTCSQFVAETLEEAGIYQFKIPYSLIRPVDLLVLNGTVIYKGDLKYYKSKRIKNFPISGKV